MPAQQPTADARPAIDQLVTFLYAADLPANHAFYGGLLGLPLLLDQGTCRIYQAGSGFVGFCRQTANIPAVDANGVVLTLVVDAKDAVDAWHRYLLLEGPDALEKAPTLNEQFNIYHLFLRDPNGYLVEIQCFLDPAWPRASLAGELPHE